MTSKHQILATYLVQALLTDPNGNQKGLDASGVPHDTIAGATANIENGSNVFVVPNPLSGNYILSLYGTDAGAVTIGLTYSDGTDTGTPETKEMTIYHSGGTQDITFSAQP